MILARIHRFFKRILLFVFFMLEFNEFKRRAEQNGKRFVPKWRNIYPRLYDKTSTTVFDTHYVYHPAWAVRVLARIGPASHVDISSTLNFSTMLSAFIPVKFYDYRMANLSLSNLTSESADLTALPFENDSIESLSCMHTVEHVGLGRYGDSLDPEGDLKAINELKRVVAPGGNLLFVVPVGKSKVMFNAHRIYSYEQIIEQFDGFELEEFSLIPDDALARGMILGASPEEVDRQTYGCGCFWFKKKR